MSAITKQEEALEVSSIQFHICSQIKSGDSMLRICYLLVGQLGPECKFPKPRVTEHVPRHIPGENFNRW